MLGHLSSRDTLTLQMSASLNRGLYHTVLLTKNHMEAPSKVAEYRYNGRTYEVKSVI